MLVEILRKLVTCRKSKLWEKWHDLKNQPLLNSILQSIKFGVKTFSEWHFGKQEQQNEKAIVDQVNYKLKADNKLAFWPGFELSFSAIVFWVS